MLAVERLLEKRDVFVEKLLLQIFGAGRDDDALARANDRQEIRERFPGAGAGFDDQVALLFQGLLDRLRHLELAATEFIRRVRSRQHSTGREELVERRICAAGS